MAEDTTKKRPRLDLDGGRERKRGKSMFGLVVGTLNKAKIEDKERSASEAAKKRQLIEQRLQTKLRKETDSVRRAEEAKKDKLAANRKEEDLQLQDSIYKFRRTRLPLYANFLLTSDVIPDDEDEDEDTPNPNPNPNVLAHPPRTHPPPLYYLPTILLPAQQSFLARRKRDTISASTHEYTLFREDRARGIVAINALRQRVADEEARKNTESSSLVSPPPAADPTTATNAPDADAEIEDDNKMQMDVAQPPAPEPAPEPAMDVDTKGPAPAPAPALEQEEKKEEPLGGDEDEAVEY